MSGDESIPARQAMDQPSSSCLVERPPSAEEDPAAMTIEFLRARLLSERSVSKAARQRAKQLAKKVSELEDRLESEIQLRKKLEADRQEILSKYRAELSADYGQFFTSSSAEVQSRIDSASESSKPVVDDLEEGFLAYIPNEDEEGLSNGRRGHQARIDSSEQLNREEAYDDDAENDQSGREKGVLSWGRRKRLTKDFGYGNDWLGRSLSQRSMGSADGESTQKRWAGKSVRQIRKKESRSSDTYFEGDSEENPHPKDIDDKNGHLDEVKEHSQCEDERDTEVERILERQAELIEQYEAEEDAQRAWEAKFKEGKELAKYKDTESITPSHSIDNLEASAKQVMKEEEVLELNVATGGSNLVVYNSIRLHGTDSTSPSHLGSENSKSSRKVHPEECSKGMEGKGETMASAALLVESCKVEKSTLSGESTKEETQLAAENTAPVTEDILPPTDPLVRTSEKQDKAASNPDNGLRIEPNRDAVVEVGKSQKYKKHLSSSFRFFHDDGPPATGSSPEMPRFGAYKQDIAEHHAETRMEEALVNGAMVTSKQVVGAVVRSDQVAGVVVMSDKVVGTELRDAPQNLNVEPKASLEHGTIVDQPLPMENGMISNDDSERSRAIHAGMQLQSPWVGGNGVMGSIPYHTSRDVPITDRFKEEFLRRRLQGGSQDFITRDSGVGSDGRNIHTQASLPGIRPGIGGAAVPHANSYEGSGFRNHCKAVDGGLDRVADVLRALQIAKLHVETSPEGTIFSADEAVHGNGYDARRPPCPSSVYGAPQRYVSSAMPYSFQSRPTQTMQGWTATSNYGLGTSRQVGYAPYVQYISRAPEQPQDTWLPPPPPQGIQKGNLYQYDTRQQR